LWVTKRQNRLSKLTHNDSRKDHEGFFDLNNLFPAVSFATLRRASLCFAKVPLQELAATEDM